MDFKKTFISLTQWTIPHGYEESIAHLLPKGVQKDGIGNYHITIGENSKTLFTCHLDTVSKREKIHHVISGNIIKTNGKTILGGDNKAGVCILMYLIEQNVPGTYYFFVGEECGTIGSRWALQNNTEFFKGFKRAVAYDRREQGSIITYQRGRRCCSDDFANALSMDFAKNRMEYHIDPNGVYTDTAVFVNVIPECTNLSAGVVGEHTNSEHVDIEYCERVAKASVKIDWENLPAIREAKEEDYSNYYNRGNSQFRGGYTVYDYRKRNGLLGNSKWKKSRDPEEEEEEDDDSILANDDHYQATGRRNNIVNKHFHLANNEEEHDCEHCDGDGIHSCENCDGMGVIECDNCDGVGRKYTDKNCKKCKGEGTVFNEVCPVCDGEGYEFTDCKKCKGVGNLGECEMCDSTGDVDCVFCNGTGIELFNDEEDDEVAGYDDDDDSSDYSSRGGSFLNEDPNDYNWRRWNNNDKNTKNGIEKFDSFLNRSNKNDGHTSLYSENLMVVRQPNGLFGVFNEKTSNFEKFNLLDEEAQEFLNDELDISNLIIQHMIQAAVNDKLSKENSEFHKSDDGLGRWRYCLNELSSKVGGENMVEEAIDEIKKYILKHGEKVAMDKKKTRRGNKKSTNRENVYENFIKAENRRDFINALKGSSLEEFIDEMKHLSPKSLNITLNVILNFVKAEDLEKDKPVHIIFNIFKKQVDELI